MALINSEENVVNRYTYDTFGVVITETETVDNPFRYAGYWYDSETGLYYLMARYYNPVNGRFLSEDPARDGYNWYVYCDNNPIIYTVVTGTVIGTATGAALGAGVGLTAQAIGLTSSGVVGTGLYKTLDQGVNFTKTTLQRMNDSCRFVPVQTLIDAIKHGDPSADPQGTKAIMYTIDLIKNGTSYKLEVLYDKASNTILHFLYK